MIENAILCVDDELDILDSLASVLLREFGNQYEIEKAESAEEALEVIDELVDDGLKLIIIISDWLMPGMKGDTFLIEVHKKYPGIVKILLTGQAGEEAIQNARDYANLHACIHKPWHTEELIHSIREGLKKL